MSPKIRVAPAVGAGSGSPLAVMRRLLVAEPTLVPRRAHLLLVDEPLQVVGRDVHPRRFRRGPWWMWGFGGHEAIVSVVGEKFRPTPRSLQGRRTPTTGGHSVQQVNHVPSTPPTEWDFNPRFRGINPAPYQLAIGPRRGKPRSSVVIHDTVSDADGRLTRGERPGDRHVLDEPLDRRVQAPPSDADGDAAV